MSFAKLLPIGQRVFWVIFLVTLPVTSFPYLPAELGGSTQVRPLAMYPLLVLLILVTVPRLFQKRLPLTFLPLFAFIAAVALSGFFSLALDIEAFKGVTIAARLLRNLITLGIGVAVYLTVALYPRSEEDLNFSLRWLYIGFGAVLLWGSFQIIYILSYNEGYFNLLNRVQSLISTQALFQTRISGFTYEPKWFAEQITFLLMPWLTAALISKRSVFRWHFRWISVESLLLLWSAIVLLFTFSRTGLFILILLTFVSVLVSRSFRKPQNSPPSPGGALPPGESRGEGSLAAPNRRLRVIEAGLAALALTVILVIVGSQNPYFSRLWRYWSDERARDKTYLEYIAFGQRFAYAETALRIFEDYPVLGVGLGNYAFFFDKKLPNRPWQNSPEIIRQITPTERGSQLVTPKNLYARLLAETGLVGTILFSSFVIAVLGCALFLLFAPLAASRYWGLAGLLGILVFVTVVFSTDSFAVPNMWVVFGLITAAAHIPENSPQTESSALAGPASALATASR